MAAARGRHLSRTGKLRISVAYTYDRRSCDGECKKTRVRRRETGRGRHTTPRRHCRVETYDELPKLPPDANMSTGRVNVAGVGVGVRKTRTHRSLTDGV